MLAICEGERRTPSSLVPGIPPELDRVALKALAATRDDRYHDAAAFQQDLLDVLHQMHRPVRQSDVQDILHVLLGRQEPTGDLLDRSTPEGIVRESSFLLPIEEPESSLESTYVRAESEAVTPKANLVPSLHDTADVTENVLPEPEENQDTTISVGPEELKAMMAAYTPTTEVAKVTPPNGPVFWLRSRQGKKSEPLSWSKVTERLDQGAMAGGSISADESHWIGVEELARLVGDDRFVEPAVAASNVSTVGSLKERGLISLFSLHARDRSTGVLAFARTETQALEWYELHLDGGRLTKVVSNVPEVQVPALLAAKAGLPEPMLGSLLYAVVKERRPLLEVAQSRGVNALEGERSTVARLSALFGWRQADYTFTLDASPSKASLAVSILRILPAVVESSLPVPRLYELLGPRLDRRYEPSWRYEDGLAELQLSEPAATIARRLAMQASLRSLVGEFAELAVLVTGYVLLEADLLVEAL